MKKIPNDFLKFFYTSYKNGIKTSLKLLINKHPSNRLTASNIEWETKECEI